jgi:Amt family ammonium transporter
MSTTINDGDTAWVLLSSSLVMLMIPGLGYFYSGLARHKSALSLIFLSMLSLAVVSIQWFLWGYSLAFSPNGSPFIGDFQYSAYTSLFSSASQTYPQVPSIPVSVFMVTDDICFVL